VYWWRSSPRRRDGARVVASSFVDSLVSPDWVRRYLSLLGVEWDSPSLVSLTALTRAHVKAIRFENITSLRRRASRPNGPVPLPDPDVLLTNWEHMRGGGVCYELASMFDRLLRTLGYQSSLILGAVTFPGAHQAVVVGLNEGRYLVDVGCGSPLFEPIPLDGEVIVRRLGLGYRFRQAEQPDTWVQDRFIEGDWAPLFRYDLQPANEREREEGYQRHHLPGESWVIGPPRLVRCTDEAVFSLRDGELVTHHPDGKQTEQITSRADYVRVANEVFRLPNLPIAEVLTQ
jgi:arylamine N-acetyltransferase